MKKETGLGLSYKKEENFGEWYSEVCIAPSGLVAIEQFYWNLKVEVLFFFFLFLLVPGKFYEKSKKNQI